MGVYISPLEMAGQVRSEGLSTVAATAATILTTPNTADADGALYEAKVYVRINTLDGGTSPTLGINIIATEGASARTARVPLQLEAANGAQLISLGAANTASGSIFFRADKNTAIQWSRTEGGSPSNNGNFDVFIVVIRIR